VAAVYASYLFSMHSFPEKTVPSGQAQLPEYKSPDLQIH